MLLGLCDAPIKGESVPYFTDSLLGGVPHWLSQDSQVPVCRLCTSVMKLIIQLYAPLIDSPHHRVIYIFACTQSTCQNESGSWCAMRSLAKCQEVSVHKPKVEALAHEGWGVDDDDWGNDSSHNLLSSVNVSDPTQEINDSLQKMEIIADPYTGLIEKKSNAAFSPFYLYVIQEPEEINSTSKQFEVEETPEAGGSKEKYEKSDVKDKEFYKFYKRIKKCPQQCVRYDLKGKPLLEPADISIPVCHRCGSRRQFECQVMPATISILHFRSEENCPISSLDFRTVLIYTCSKDCFVSSSEEFSICVPEPDIKIPVQNKDDLIHS